MKCTLRKVEGGIVATIDERPNIKGYFYGLISGKVRKYESGRTHDHWYTIIASTILNVGKELEIFYNTYSKATKEEVLTSMINKQYDYTETETQVIIEL